MITLENLLSIFLLIHAVPQLKKTGFAKPKHVIYTKASILTTHVNGETGPKARISYERKPLNNYKSNNWKRQLTNTIMGIKINLKKLLKLK